MDKYIVLNDGRKLGYEEYGCKEGIPLFLFHGTPGSRLWFMEDDEIAKDSRIRIITTDRPGYGLSSEKKNRTVLDWVDDIVQLADQLKIEKFSVGGVSGGGAFAAACGYKIPERLSEVLLISSATPFENGKPPKDMCKENKLAFFLSRKLPTLVRVSTKMQMKMMREKPTKFIEAMKKQNKHLCDWDRQYVQKDEDIMETMMHLKEAYRSGVDESINEVVLLSKSWGFPVEQIQVPVHIWHGTSDTLSPYSAIRKLVNQIPNSHLNTKHGAGHFLTSDETIWKEILETVSQSAVTQK